jgi:hypothetical protein
MTVARAAVQSLLEGSTTLAALGFTSIMAANSADAPPQQRFIVIRWEGTTAFVEKRGTSRLQIWFHDTDRDYTAIADAMEIAREALINAVHVTGADGVKITTVRWDEDSPDLFDDGYGTVTKWSAFTVAARR